MAETSKLNGYAIVDIATVETSKLNAYAVIDTNPLTQTSKLNAYAVVDDGFTPIGVNKGSMFIFF